MAKIITTIMDTGAVALLPIVMTLLGLIFGMGIKKALRAGLYVGIGFQGLSLVVGLLMSTINPAIEYFKSLGGEKFTTVDMGWAALGGASWSAPFAAVAMLLIVLINVLLILFNATKVLNVDVWNFIHFLIPGTLSYALTGSYFIGLAVTVGLSVITLFVSEKFAKTWGDYFGVEGTTCTTFSFITFSYPFAVLLNKIFDHIPGLKNADFTVDGTNSKLRFLNDTAIMGAIVGIFLGLISKQNIQTLLIMSIGIASVMVLIPKMVSVMMEGLSAIGTGAQAFMRKRIGEDAELYVGMDIALGLGDPVVITVSVLMLPIAILFAFLIPNMRYFPVGLLTVIVYMVPLIVMASKGNFVRSFISCVIFLFIVEFCAHIFAPEATAMVGATGVEIEGMVTDGFFGFNLANIIICIIYRILM